MFRAALLLLIRRYLSVYTAIRRCRLCRLAVGRILPTASQHKRMTYTKCCIHTVAPPDNEQ